MVMEVSCIALSSKCLKWQSVTKVALILFLMVLLICSAVHCLNSLKKIKCHSIEVEPELDRNSRNSRNIQGTPLLFLNICLAFYNRTFQQSK